MQKSITRFEAHLVVLLMFSFAESLTAQVAASFREDMLRNAGPMPQSLTPLQIEPQGYGVQDSNYLFIPATDFRPFESSTTYTTDSNFYVYRTGGSFPTFSHQIELPQGALLESLTLYFYDADGPDITLGLCAAWVETNTGLDPNNGCAPPVSSTGSPGYDSIVLNFNQSVDRLRQLDADPALEEIRYVVYVELNSTFFHGFAGVRLKWKRQISPAPATARFTDVPTNHPFFQFIEALAASGITAGCNITPPQYCPDATLTRGQMAVFLARALGLHWAP